MTTIALPRPITPHRAASGIVTLAPSPISIDTRTPQPSCTPVPNKHIPICPTGPAPYRGLATPPPSPSSHSPHDEEETAWKQPSLLFPPDGYARSDFKSGIFDITPAQLAAAIDHKARQSLPDPSHVFPWQHGLHPDNHIQQAFFTARRRVPRKTPPGLRGLTLVKADGQLTSSRLKGAVAPEEILAKAPGQEPEFLDLDPMEGFSVRNFQIQTAKWAAVSDVVVYGEEVDAVRQTALDVVAAQGRWRTLAERRGDWPSAVYNTFMCVSPFGRFEDDHSELVVVDSAGRLTGKVVDFGQQERIEMQALSRASEISHNVWLGSTPEAGSEEEDQYDITIECGDMGRLNPNILRLVTMEADGHERRHYLDFPSSGSILPPTWSQCEADGILETCKWIWHLAHGTLPREVEAEVAAKGEKGRGDGGGDTDVDTDMSDGNNKNNSSSDSEAKEPSQPSQLSQPSPPPSQQRPRQRPRRQRKVLIHCADGYTESTMLGIAYYSFSTAQSIPDAWLSLHTVQKRNFFAYPADVALLVAISPRLQFESPASPSRTLAEVTSLLQQQQPHQNHRWLSVFDGSFPSRILEYMYLGNLGHARNTGLLRALGIGQVLSIGEKAVWADGEAEAWGKDKVMFVQDVQDNGLDPLMEEFERCLDFIDRGRRNGTATLVHCRVGVSRSATICIAEVMRELGLSFPRAYCRVRARRLNVIIQPHLRFVYELLQWEEKLLHHHQQQQQQQKQQQKQRRRDGDEKARVGREMEWCEVAREIAVMNRPYTR